jgi:hypothetical protein
VVAAIRPVIRVVIRAATLVAEIPAATRAATRVKALLRVATTRVPWMRKSFGSDCFDAANWLLGDQFNEHESMEDDDDGDVALDALADIWRGHFQEDYQAVDDYTIKKLPYKSYGLRIVRQMIPLSIRFRWKTGSTRRNVPGSKRLDKISSITFRSCLARES